jgi:NAD(P)-dependent dehydrogenase (short-subunit alcohol dehydrogenase family)
VVTGASGGLGRALTGALGELGAHIVGIDRQGAEGVPSVTLLEADLADDSQARAAVEEAVAILGGMDALVGAAGVVDTIHRARSFPMEAFRADVEVNLLAQFAVAQAAHPALKESGSSAIVFVSSIAAQDGLPGQASYAASKAGVLGLTRTLAAEWAADGVRVNAIVPGLFATPKVLAMPESARDRMLASVPLRRVGTLGEVVGSILYLLSPAAGYTTGQALRLDGGAGLTLGGLYR